VSFSLSLSAVSAASMEREFLHDGGIVGLFFERVSDFPDDPFLHRWENDRWMAWTWGDTGRRVRSLANALRRFGLVPGDRVLIVSENRVEWHVSALAIMSIGAITVPLPPTATAEEWAHIVRNADPAACILSPGLRQKFAAIAEFAAWQGHRIEMTSTPSAGAASWDELAAGDGPPPPRELRIDRVCCVIYTSGTRGIPKGVEQTHRNLLSNAVGAALNLQPYGIENERFLSTLPLSHSYEHTAGFVTPIAIGARIFVSRGPEHFAHELRTARPTVLIVVPRLCELLQQRITAEVARQPRVRQRLFALTERIGRRQASGARLRMHEIVWHATLGALVRRQLRAHVGDTLKCMLSAGAPLRSDTFLFFNGLGLPLHQAYGQTEAGPGLTMQPKSLLRPGTVGLPMHGMNIRLAEDGEVLAQGPNVMRGYWRDPEGTTEALSGGWLHTGDIGRLEPDGSLVIVDRKKDILKTAGGEMVAPQPIELALTSLPDVCQAMVVGDGWAHLGALLVPNAALLEASARGNVTAAEIRARLQAAVDIVNASLPPTRRIRKFAVAMEPFTLQNGLLTGSLKTRRKRVLEAHQATIATLAN
jgi:long-chain acyl-CoA synthetase